VATNNNDRNPNTAYAINHPRITLLPSVYRVKLANKMGIVKRKFYIRRGARRLLLVMLPFMPSREYA
jgi:hypothetical protein